MEGIHIMRSRPHGWVEWAAFRPTPQGLTRFPVRAIAAQPTRTPEFDIKKTRPEPG